MAKQLFSFLLLACLPAILAQEILTAGLSIDGSRSIAETDENFVCATIDWWPHNKCNYNQCPWAYSSIMNLNLSHPLLAKAVQAFTHLRIRLGGSLEDQVLYGVPSLKLPCHPFWKQRDGLFGFSKGCLRTERWDALNHFFTKTGYDIVFHIVLPSLERISAIVTFSLNALYGRRKTRKGPWTGPWDSSNAHDFMKYTISKGYQIDSWEFGNELSGSGIGASVNAKQYGEDLIKLKRIINELYEKSSSKPSVLAPGGFFEKDWFAQLLQVTGPGVVDGVTHHIYDLGAGDDPNLAKKILDPDHLNKISDTFGALNQTIRDFGPWASAWVGEAGGAYNSGGHLVSDSFINSFCALLFNRLMGQKVLPVHIDASPHLHAYAHCTKGRAGITLLLINLSNETSFIAQVKNAMNKGLHLANKVLSREVSFTDRVKKLVSWVGSNASDGRLQREEYHLTPKDGNLRSQTVMLNGKPLEISEVGDIPSLEPVLVSVNSPLYISPLSIAFIVFPNFDAPACQHITL
ncbi:hypothetical protein Cgig2_017822 [Carnegiea gigantea]|uniref:Heparanase-like protein 2 n=1 Tax=Carnegiea gigantea TaxID=171969 RepID=A0A9Q1KZ29_9CARY|nr:hypothetical protein Cgig2_017822 [Carnegiea gigantea]